MGHTTTILCGTKKEAEVGQMGVCSGSLCDFFVYTKKGQSVEGISFAVNYGMISLYQNWKHFTAYLNMLALYTC